LKIEPNGVVVEIGSQNPRRGKRDKDGAASGVEMNERVGQPATDANALSRIPASSLTPFSALPRIPIRLDGILI
jgi:hypothetical protein